jgi:hypothetical protein
MSYKFNPTLTPLAQDSSLITINTTLGTINTSVTGVAKDSSLQTIIGKIPNIGTAGSASANVLTVQGIASMTPLLVSGSNLALETGGNLATINTSVTGVAKDSSLTTINSSIGTTNTTLGTINTSVTGVAKDSSLTTINSSIGTTNTTLGTINTSVTGVAKDSSLSTINTSIGTTNTTLGTINTSVTGVAKDSSLSTINTSIGTTNTTLGTINTSVTGVAKDSSLSTINTSIGTTNTTLGTINTSVTGVAKDSSLTTINTSIGTTNTTLGTINTSVTGVAKDSSLTTINSSILAGPNNVATALRDSFQTFINGVNWTLSLGSGDIVQVDGNSGGASYLVISKDPLTANTETSITSTATFTIPTELTTGISMSQRTLGQELSVEIVSSDTQNTPLANLAISSIQQGGSLLTVTTSTAHGLVPGSRIGIFGVTGDSRLNYPALVVATITSTVTFTCTYTPIGGLASFSSGPFTSQGTVYIRPALGYAQDGMSFIFENTTLTNASVYVRQDNGATWSSGTVNGNHSINIGSAVSQQTASAYTYNFTPTTEYRMMLQSDRATLTDAGVDSITFAGTNTRLSRTQQVPNSTKTYRLRYRFTNDAGLTIPTAKIVSAVKTGTTTATITTASVHGLTTTDYVIIYGINDQTNFANQTGQVIVLSTPTTTSFTVAFGTAVTATSYGGMVARAQGGANYPTGFPNLSILNIVVAANAAGSNELTLSGATTGVTFAGSYLIGDYVNVYGVRSVPGLGSDVGVDGTYRVVNNATGAVTLAPIGTTTLPSTISLTNTGGFIIKRTDARIHFSRMLNFQRERVELNARADPSNGYPVIVTSIPTTNTNTFLTYNAGSTDAASAAITTTTTTTITPANSTLSYEVMINVSVASGTGQTMDVVIQESDDSGTNFYDVYHFPRITAAGQYRTPLITLYGNRMRYVQTIGGTLPSFTRVISRVYGHSVVPCFRQFYDRTIVPNTLSSTTAAYNVQGTKDLTVMVSMGAVTTTAPVMQVQISPDNSSWVQVGSNITTVASTNTFFQVAGVQANFVRLIVSTAGTGATLNFVFIKAMG